jgi:hypothetical protein
VDVTVKGTVLGIRENRGRHTDLSTGVVTEDALRGYYIDLYQEGVGFGEIECKPDVKLPPEHATITASVAVRAYSGFVRKGVAGDARVIYTLNAFRVDEKPTPAPSPNGRAQKAAATA